MHREWRVGTLSMGVLLIVLGCVLFVSQIQGWSSIQIIFKLWPLVLIMLGAEILGFLFFSRKENSVVKYDGFSIFIILVIVFFSVAAYAIKICLDYGLLHGHIFIK